MAAHIGTTSVMSSRVSLGPTSVRRVRLYNPPQVVSIRGVGSGVNRVTVTFDEELAYASAINLANYDIPGVGVTSVNVDGTVTTVTLETGTLVAGNTYTLNISGVRDLSTAANVLNTNVTFVAEAAAYADQVLAVTDQAAVVANSPLTTIRLKRTRCPIGNQICEVIDTPGLHCLYIHSEEELVVRQAIFSERPDVIIQCIGGASEHKGIMVLLTITGHEN